MFTSQLMSLNPKVTYHNKNTHTGWMRAIHIFAFVFLSVVGHENENDAHIDVFICIKIQPSHK